ncbi:AraC family transcriptional regulator [Halarcobacter sp.]|uniref:AraC family transcriptional regulator n=1 Tax=Halarcobacter sp. TaxID=2321133 RepID=UPI0029F5AB1A|nr:AraC family transcriptional regulator [Halarcobacter sp.]
MDTLSKIKEIVNKYDLEEGLNKTNIPFVKVFKSSNSSEILQSVYEPSLFLILQGSKKVMVGDKIFEYDSSSYFISSTHLAVSGKTVKASKDKPFISLQIAFKEDEIFQALNEFSLAINKINSTNFSASIYRLDNDLKDCVFRLLSLNKIDIDALSKLYLKEILYRLLVSNQNKELQQLAFIESNSYKISKAITLINENIYDNFLVDDIAKEVNMSISSFHKNFKIVVGISPLQYIKKIKLQEAKRLMTLENMDISGASFYVGYKSCSQFSREYSSYFGMSPSKHIKSLRD